MITKAHILSFSIIIALYAVVAIWKMDSSSIHQNNDNFRQATENYSSEAVFWKHYNQANDYRSKGLYQKAVDEYRQALEVNAHHKDALYYTGSMHLLLKEYRQTKKYWEQLLNEEPNAPRTHLQLGTLYFCMDQDNLYLDLDKAGEYISHAWELNREETGAPLLLSKIALLKSDLETSENILDDLLATDETNIEALFLTGYIQWRNGYKESSREFFTRAEREFQMQSHKILEGEGNTETGARAMLSEDRFCDGFEVTFKRLMQDNPGLPAGEVFSNFEKIISAWRREFGITG